ncbi:MAG TPA: VOC family protein [candidate division Zixibacteria bacterium]|nr:VOC family protein [candidate division Zixibacteria bacterium]
MAKIKHIAIRTRDVEKTAAFYKAAFGLREVGLGRNGVYLTDGYLNVAVLGFQAGADGEPLRLGLDHLGFQVDDLEAALDRIRRSGGTTLAEGDETPPTDPGRRSYYEVKCLGPDGQVIDVSAGGWVGAPPVEGGTEEGGYGARKRRWRTASSVGRSR